MRDLLGQRGQHRESGPREIEAASPGAVAGLGRPLGVAVLLWVFTGEARILLTFHNSR